MDYLVVEYLSIFKPTSLLESLDEWVVLVTYPFPPTVVDTSGTRPRGPLSLRVNEMNFEL